VRKSEKPRKRLRYGSVKRAISLPHFVSVSEGIQEKNIRIIHNTMYSDTRLLTIFARVENTMNYPPHIGSLFRSFFI